MHRAAAALMCVVLVLTGCGGDDDDETAPDAVESDDGSTTTATPGLPELPADCDPIARDATELARFQPEGAPEGFELRPEDEHDTGPSDLAKAIRDDGYPDAEQLLTDLGFRRGYQWIWVRGDDQLIAFVYEFCAEDGAEVYAARGDEDDDLEPFDVALDGASGRSAGDSTSVARAQVVRGPYLLLVIANGEIGVKEAESRATELLRGLVAAVGA